MEGLLIIWRNKGFMVPIYYIISRIVMTTIFEFLPFNSDIIFNSIDNSQLILGLSLILSGLLSYYYRDEYCVIDGKKIQLDLINEFFFIRMELWAYMKFGFGILVIIGAIAESFLSN